MSLRERCSGNKVHNRNISIATYGYDENNIVVEGVLQESRLVMYYGFTGERSEPGCVHHMIIRMLVDNTSRKVKEVEVEMPVVPTEACLELKTSLDWVEGLEMVTGFSSQVKKRVGGSKGCAHLTDLLLVMVTATFQGAWVHRRRDADGRKVPLEMVEHNFIDSCWVLRREGPLAKQYFP